MKLMRFCFLLALACCFAVGLSQFTPADADEINQSIAAPALTYMQQDTFPDASVEPEIIATCEANGYASASWVWGETGGIVILQRQSNRWTVLGGTGGVYSPAELNAEFGIPVATGERLLCE